MFPVYRPGHLLQLCLSILLSLTLGGLLTTPAPPVHAQTTDPLDPLTDPLLLLDDNTLWRWTAADGAQAVGEAFPAISGVLLSPAGTHVLVQTVSPHVQTLLDAECPCGGTVPDGREYWLVDLATGDRVRISPDYAQFTNLSAVPVVGDALWSPDGSQVVWAEGLEVSDLWLFELPTGELTRVDANIPAQARVSNVAALSRWTPTGIWVPQVIFADDPRDDLPGGYAIYTPAGEQVTAIPPYRDAAGLPEVPVFDDHPAYAPFNHFPVDASGTDALLTHALTGWQLLALESGTMQPLTGGTVVEVAATAPATSLRLHPAVYDPETGNFRHELYLADDTHLSAFNSARQWFTLSGSAVVIERQQRIITLVTGDGSTYNFELPDADSFIIPTPMRLLLEGGGGGEATPALLVGNRCEGSGLPFRFPIIAQAGTYEPTGHVLGDTPNNLRDLPTRDSAVVDAIAGGGSFEVLEGPVCADGIAWWRVEGIDGQMGWTAEGVDGEYFLAPGCSVAYCNAEG